MIKRIISVLMPLFFLGACASLQGLTISEQVQKTFDKNFTATQSENIEALLSTIHTQSSMYKQSRNVIGQIFEQYDLTYKLETSQFIGQDDTYAYLRARFVTERARGPKFRDNIFDGLFIFKQEDGEWKFWNQIALDVQYLN